jgi:outer membrane protein
MDPTKVHIEFWSGRVRFLVIPIPFLEQMDNNKSKSFSISLSIPIFNALQVSTGIKNAKINVQNYDYQLQIRKNQLYAEIQQAYADAVSAFESYQASAKAVTSSEEAFRYTEQRFNVGLVTSVDYNTSKEPVDPGSVRSSEVKIRIHI